MSLGDIQRRLAAAGFDAGKPDGLWGRQTEAAAAALLDAYGALRAVGEDVGSADPLDPETDLLIAELRRDEGEVLAAYQDHLGYWTIGVGRLIDKRRGGGISAEESAMLLRGDIERVRENLDLALPWWRGLDPVRQRAVQNMCFQLGIGGLTGFKNSLRYLERRDYTAAAANLRLSLWARQTPERAGRVIRMIESGTA